MVLYSKEDQYVPDFVDINSLVRRWEATYRSQGFAAAGTFEILPHANHELVDERYSSLDSELPLTSRAQIKLCSLVVNFLRGVNSGKSSKVVSVL